ncbi:putative quinol monooxygenase [Pelagibius marinus]|uniref:putative quinol monooxygenase n=1 Tax=Pelagibius marinus TaxID=2762760 RepID=UPI0018728061|nr:antibiotic biosynthesis monooxygenase family protein [Pelagibius marinus]
MTAKHVVIVTFEPEAGSADEFHRLMQSVKADLPKVKGCDSVLVLRHGSAETQYTLVEEWQDAALHSAHLERMVSSGAWAKLEALLSAPPCSDFYVPL